MADGDGEDLDDVEVTLHLPDGGVAAPPPGTEGTAAAPPTVPGTPAEAATPAAQAAQAETEESGPAADASAAATEPDPVPEPESGNETVGEVSPPGLPPVLPPPSGPRLDAPSSALPPPSGPRLADPSAVAPASTPPPAAAPPAYGPPVAAAVPAPPSNPLPPRPGAQPLARRPGGPGAGGAATAAGVLAILTGVLVLAGTFLPVYDVFGFEASWAEGWGQVATIVTGLVLIGGGIASFVTPIGPALAAGAAITFAGIFAPVLRTTFEVLDVEGSDATLGLGFLVWLLAALSSVAVIGLGLASLRSTARPAWPFVAGAVGMALFWVGLFVGTDLFGDDGGSNVAVAVLLLGLPLAALLAVALRTPAAAALAIGTACPWVASWLVYAVDGQFGGLPAPFPQFPFVAGLTVLAMICLGGVWWMAPAVGAGAAAGVGGAATGVGVGTAGVGLAGMGATQLASIIICASVGVATLGGTAAAVSDSRGEGYSVASYGSSYEGQTYSGSGSTELSGSSGSSESAGSSSSGSASDPGATPSDGFETEECTDPIACPDEAGGDQTGTAAAPYSPPAGRWVVILGSVFFSEGQGALDARFAQLLGGFPDAEVLDSNSYTSLRPDVWAIYIDRDFFTGEEAAAHCHAIGLPSNQQCYGRYLSDEPGLDWQDPSLIANP